MAKSLSVKDKKKLIYKDGAPKGKGCLNALLTTVFIVSLIAFIGTTLVYFVTMILWPILYIVLIIVTLGTILLSDTEIIPTDFLESLVPVIVIALIVCAAAFVLKFIVDWLYILNQSRKLNKDPKENKNYIAIAKVVRKLKIADIFVFAVRIGIVVLAVILTLGADPENMESWMQVLMWGLLALFIVVPIFGGVYARKQFRRIDADVQTVYSSRNTIRMDITMHNGSDNG